jgi:hypothetical protein
MADISEVEWRRMSVRELLNSISNAGTVLEQRLKEMTEEDALNALFAGRELIRIGGMWYRRKLVHGGGH